MKKIIQVKIDPWDMLLSHQSMLRLDHHMFYIPAPTHLNNRISMDLPLLFNQAILNHRRHPLNNKQLQHFSFFKNTNFCSLLLFQVMKC